MERIQLESPSKINLWLRILGRRDDGFHEVETRLCKLALHDSVEISASPAGGGAILTCSNPDIPVDESNLALRALRAFEHATGIHKPWQIHLEKRIPAGAGLGGGSSNAAAVLNGLNTLCGHPLDQERLLGIAAGLGSDVPFFVLGGPAADASGHGERVAPVAFPWRLPVVLIKPAFPIETPWAYKHWADSKELAGVPYVPQICPWGAMVNGLERPVFAKHILLATLKTKLLEQGETRAALMSGSGSTMFAITETSVAAEDLAAKVRQWCGETTWVQVTFTKNDA